MAQEPRSLIVLALLAACLPLAGCPSRVRTAPEPEPSTVQPATPVAPPAGSAPSVVPVPQRPPAPPRENRLSPATQTLVKQAKAAMTRGDLVAASATLDRALRIEPSNPLLWVEMGRLRLNEADSHQAETCARKALALASGDPPAQRQAGRVLIDALRAQGRNQDAHELETRPYMR